MAFPVCQCAPTEATDDAPPLHELSPSAKLVYTVLEYEGELSQQQLQEASRLPDRTLRSAIATLTEEGFLEERTHIADARQRVYSIAADGSPDPDAGR